MRSSRSDGKGGGEKGGQLLQELEALSQALYKAKVQAPAAPPSSNQVPRREFDKTSHRRRVSEVVGRAQKPPSSLLESRHSISDMRKNDGGGGEAPPSDAADEDEDEDAALKLGAASSKKGFWNWKPLRALSHIGQQRFPCEFSAHVHFIEKLPASMNGLRLQVQLRHRDSGVQSMPARAAHGRAEFEEVLQFRCTIYGSKSKSSGGVKFMSKSFTLSVVAMDVEELDLGKHELDLSRILPAHDSPASATLWNTSFKLAGKAKGSALSVSFGYEILDAKILGSSGRFGQSPAKRSGVAASRSFNSLPNSPHGSSRFHKKSSSSVVDFGSPAVSEPGAGEYDYAGMDQFKLDDPEPPPPPLLAPPPKKGLGLPPPPPKPVVGPPPAAAIAAPVVGDGVYDRRGRSLFPDLDSAIAPGTPGRSQEQQREDPPENVEEQSDLLDDAEFGVVEKGVETSVLDLREDQRDDRVEDRKLQEQEQQEQQEQSLDYKFEEEEEEDEDEEGKGGGGIATDTAQDHYDDNDEKPSENARTESLERDAEKDYDWKQSDKDLNGGFDWKNVEEEAEKLDWMKPAAGGGEEYDWKEELQRDYFFDSLKNPGLSDWQKNSDAGARKEEQAAARETSKDLDGGDKKMIDEYDDEIVADEFLDMLQEPAVPKTKESKYEKELQEEEAESPRALLLKQFEQEAMLVGGDGGFGTDVEEALDRDALDLDLDDHTKVTEPQERDQKNEGDRKSVIVPEEWSSDEDKELASIMDAAESELQKATQALRSKARAKMLEDAEAEALLQEWGLDEKVFVDGDAPSAIADDARSIPAENKSLVVRSSALDLPELSPGIGASVPTADGGELRSMDPALFQSGGKSDGKLVMHVSKPVVVPAEMGSSAIEVLRNFASAGTENMAAQAMEAMPLEDITGKSVEQIAFEGQACFEENNRRYDTALLESNRYALEDGTSTSGALAIRASSSALSQARSARKHSSAVARRSKNDEFASLDELAPVAMEKIEQLAMQGLRIQCDMAEEEAPYAIEAAPPGVPLLKAGGSSSSLFLEAPPAGASDGMIAMSLSLDEWMRLDAGLDDDDAASDKSKTVMAAHRAAHGTALDLEAAATTDLVLNLSDETPALGGSGAGSSGFGKMGNTLTLAMLVQLRDPLRNYEPVGAPMMALVEAERVLVSPPKPKLWKHVAIKGNSERELDDEEEEEQGREAEVDREPQFKVTGVHVAGLSLSEEQSAPFSAKSSSSTSKKAAAWGNQRQQQSGSRWLLANGMGKSTAAAASKHPLLRSGKMSASKAGRQSDSSSLWSVSAAPSGVARNPDVKFGKSGGKKW